ncbi:MAG: hypothetical protein HKM93_23020 [Desulfobacteraceae bacterium]|nr:hypothetical protein [Desulfobacteraceae bacterium]
MKYNRRWFGVLLVSARDALSPCFIMANAAMIVILAVAFPAEGAALVLSKTTLPATGRQEAVLTIPDFGRYALSVQGPEGSALQLIDRMAGPGDRSGEAGISNGRIDTFLEHGQYKLIITSHEKGEGTATLSVRPFTERNMPSPPLLVAYKTVRSELKDVEQRSFWLRIPKDEVVAIEAAGRSLTDLRFWKDGSWLVDAVPEKNMLEPAPGRFLRVCRLTARLNAGLYRVTAYGGIPLDWTGDDDRFPFHIRYGIPTLPTAGRGHYEAGPFGLDRFLVPKSATFYRLELPEAENARIQVSPFNPNRPFAVSGPSAGISKKSVPPVAELSSARADNGYNQVTIQRETGKPYVLQHFNAAREHRIKGNGAHWISTITAGDVRDTVDVTSLLTETPRHQTERLVDRQLVRLDERTGWRGKFNLLSQLTLFIDVRDAGGYTLSETGAHARYRIEPFFIRRPKNYEPPAFRNAGYTWDLDTGIYKLTMSPASQGKGILEVRLDPVRAIGAPEYAFPLYGNRYGSRMLDNSSRYTLYLNQRPGVKTGLVLRPLPIDLQDALPVTHEPGRSLDIPIRVDEPGDVRAVAGSGQLIELAVDRSALKATHHLTAGQYRIRIPNDGDKAFQYNLEFLPERLKESVSLPPLPERELAAIPDFRTLDDTSPIYLDLKRRQTATFNVKVASDSLYRLASTGLLETEGNLRTRTMVSFDRQAANGVGRNFLIQQYLRQGDYQLSVKPRGQTRGHLGVMLSRTPLRNGGRLISGIPVRKSLPAGEGIQYEFQITETGRYRVETLGLNRAYTARLEDAGGWPLTIPGQRALFDRRFSPGVYRLVILPQPVTARAVTLFEKVPEPMAFSGHGPHHIDVNTSVGHRWMEPEPGGERVPDQWCFTLPAPADVRIALGALMSGDLVDPASQTVSPDMQILPGKTWSAVLDAGEYCLRAKSVRPNNRLDYVVAISTLQLVSGDSRQVNAPADIPLSVSRSGLVEISSYGSQDVRAMLYDGAGNLIDGSDDRSEDWNFYLARRLEPGFYRLRVAPVGATGAQCRISMVQSGEIMEPPLEPPADFSVADIRVHTFPITGVTPGTVLVATGKSDHAMGMSIEIQGETGWSTLQRLSGTSPAIAVPVREADTRLRLQVWTVDQRPAEMAIHVLTVDLTPGTEADTGNQRLNWVNVHPSRPDLHLAALNLSGPGLLAFNDANAERTLVSTGALRAFEPVNDIITADQDRIWLLINSDRPPGESMELRRVRLSAAGDVQFSLPPQRRARMNVTRSRGDSHLLITADSRSGHPGVAAVTNKPSPVDMDNSGGGEHTAAALMAGKGPGAVHIWDAGGSAAGLSVALAVHEFIPGHSGGLTWGVNDIELLPGHSRTYDLPEGVKRIKLVVPARTAVRFLGDGRQTGLGWSGDRDMVATYTRTADQVAFYHTGSSTAMAEATLLPPDTAALPMVAADAVFTRYFSHGGVFELKVDLPAHNDGEGFHLFVRGPESRGIFLDHDGRLQSGRQFRLPGSGRLLLHHGRGVTAVWLESRKTNPWQVPAARNTVTVRAGNRTALTGKTMTLRYNRDTPTMLSLGTDIPALVRVGSADGPSSADIHADGVDLHHYLPAGENQVTLVALGTQALSGIARHSFTAIRDLKEGLGPMVRLAPGENRLFSFAVTTPGRVGVGVRGDSDQAVSRLMDNEGRVLGQGLVQIHDLPAGTYVLEVSVPKDARAVQVQPAVVGIQPPDKGPPEEVIRRYLEMEKGEDEF